jgi:hypothetical protein
MNIQKVISIICLIMLCFCMPASDNSTTHVNKQNNGYETPKSVFTQQTKGQDSLETLTRININLTVGYKVFSAKLYKNQTTQPLVKKFPITVDMSELNGNEKYYYLEGKLPTASQKPGEIHAGEIMLYGDDCLVVFYKNFSSSYQYTRLGYIEDAVGFARVVGDRTCKITLDLVKNENR